MTNVWNKIDNELSADLRNLLKDKLQTDARQQEKEGGASSGVSMYSYKSTTHKR